MAMSSPIPGVERLVAELQATPLQLLVNIPPFLQPPPELVRHRRQLSATRPGTRRRLSLDISTVSGDPTREIVIRGIQDDPKVDVALDPGPPEETLARNIFSSTRFTHRFTNLRILGF